MTEEITAIEKAWTEHVEREDRRSPREPHAYVYASSRRRCLRRMTLECSRPSELPEFNSETKARFARGKRRELDITTDLQRVGQLCIPKFEFVGQQERVRVYDRKQRLVISGMIDGYIRWESGAIWPTEIKSLSAFTTDRISSFEDLYQGRYTWANAHQILSYLFSKNAPFGLFVMDRSGLPRLLKVDLEKHLESMESFLADATVVVDHLEAGTLPPFIDDAGECRKCPAFGSLCQPELSYVGASLITDEALLAAIDQHEALDEPRKEYKDLHEQLAETLAAMTPKEFKNGVKKQIIAGKFLIETTWQKSSTTDTDSLAPEVLAALMVAKKTDDAGKFSFKIVKVTE